MSNARDKANIPSLNFSSTGIDDNATSTAITISSDERVTIDADDEKALVVHHNDGSIVRIGMNNNSTNSNEIAFDSTDFIVKPGGFEKFRITSSGNVGIGTTSPGARLETKNATDGSTFAFQATNDNDHEIVQIGAQSDGDGYLTVHGQGASTNIKVRLDSDGDSYFTGGNVGIGTNSPGFDLVVKDASGTATIRAENGADNKIVDLIADSTGGLLRTVGSYPLVLNTNQTERMRIDSSGNVGISNTTPGDFNSQARNLVIGGGSGDTGMTIYSGSSSGDTGNIFFADGTSGSDPVRGGITYNHGDNSMNFRTNDGANRIYISSAGNVGINTSSPSAKLHVDVSNSGVTPHANADELFVEGSTHSGITIGSGTSSSGNIYFGDSADNSIGRIAYNHSSDKMDFMNNGRNAFYMQNHTNISLNTSSYTVIDSIPFGAYLVVIGQASNNTSREVWLLLRIGAAYSVAATRLLQRTATGGGDNRTFDVRGTTGGNLEAKLTAGSSMTNCEVTLFKFGM